MENETVATPETTDAPIVEQVVETPENTEPNVEAVEEKPEKTFTQKELDEIITKRIERERETVTKKASQAARDAYVAEQGYEWQGKTITTESEYNQALKDRDLIESYKDRNLPDEVVNELVENRKFREKYEADQLTTAQKDKQTLDAKQFLETFPDAKPEDIPPAVWDEVNSGARLIDAFTRHENQQLKRKLQEIEQAKQIEQQNAENAASSTGSVTGNGSVAPAFFTLEQVQKMSQADVDKNYTAIMASQKKWYK